MRIAQILAPAPFGGLERVVSQLSVGLARRGHEVYSLILVEEGNSPLPGFVTELSDAGVRVEPVRTPHRAYMRERNRVRDLLESISPDVVHTHGYHADILLRSVAQRLSIPTLATVHGFTGGDWKNRLFEWLQRRSL